MQKLEYEWEIGIQYYNRIYQFLNEVDAIMLPPLSERVCISDYAEKLACLAETLFIVQDGCDIASCSVYCNSETAFISTFPTGFEAFELLAFFEIVSAAEITLFPCSFIALKSDQLYV